MSMITPITVEGFPQYARPWNNITPFTYRDGMTYLEVLEGMRTWLKDSLIPHVNTEMVEIGSAWNTEVLALVAEVESALATQATNVNNSVDSRLADNLTTIDTMVADINARADLWLDQTFNANDTTMSAVIDDPASLTRGSLATYVDTRAPAVYSGVTGDNTAALQAFLDGLPVGRRVELRGTIDFTTLDLNVAGIHLYMTPGTVLRKTDSATNGLSVNVGNITIEGGSIDSPAAWDGTNTAWGYAVIHVKEGANNVTIKNVTLNNIHKVGIGVRSDAVNISNCRINGNYPAASWTGVETAHFGISFDPTTQERGGSGIVANNHIRGCVQGVHTGNYGASTETGFAIVGNNFEGCHNHGVYAQAGSGNTVSSNVFRNCQLPVVISGKSHIVSSNTMYTINTGGNLDKTGISVRDGVGCIVKGNTIVGDSTGSNIAISIDALNGTEVSSNVISGNVVILNGSANYAIRLGNGAVTCVNNTIENNFIRGGGLANNGVIRVNTSGGGNIGKANSVKGNKIVTLNNTYGIYMVDQLHSVISDNYIENNSSPATATTLIQVYLANVKDSIVSTNMLVNPSTHGSNVTLRGIQEDMNSDRNVHVGNTVKHDTTLLVSSVPVILSNGTSTTMTGEQMGRYATATTLGALSGKMEVRGPGGTVRGFVPVYTTIT